MKTLSSKDCVTTEKKAAFMMEACKPECVLFIVSDKSGTSNGNIMNDMRFFHNWNFDRFEYELRPAPLTDAQKIEKVLKVSEDCLLDASERVSRINKLLKGQPHDE